MAIATIPSVNALLRALWAYLSGLSSINTVAALLEDHPEKPGQVLESKARIVMSILPVERTEGRVISESMLSPRIQFACWATTNFTAQDIKERLKRAVEHMGVVNADPKMTALKQRVSCVRRVGGVGPTKSTATNLYFATLNVEFYLNALRGEL
jgi:hypothetical protein